jgi:hypothetical protein
MLGSTFFFQNAFINNFPSKLFNIFLKTTTTSLLFFLVVDGTGARGCQGLHGGAQGPAAEAAADLAARMASSIARRPVVAMRLQRSSREETYNFHIKFRVFIRVHTKKLRFPKVILIPAVV